MALQFGNNSFTVIRGLTWAETIKVTDDEDDNEATPGDPIDLTGATFLMRLRENIDGPVIMELSSGNGRLIAPNPTDGTINLLVFADDTTAELPANDNMKAKYLYDAIIIRGTGPEQVREPIISGKVTVKPSVTQQP